MAHSFTKYPSALVLILLFNIFFILGSATLHADPEAPVYFKHQRRALADATVLSPIAQNVSSSDLQKAQSLVAAALAQQEEYNRFRVANPRRNTYRTKPSVEKRAIEDGAPPSPSLTEELQAAASLLAEHTAAKQLANGTLHNAYNDFLKVPQPVRIDQSGNETIISGHEKRDTEVPYWVASMSGNGLPPMGYDASYSVFRDVTKYGAKGDGVTDDTAAINAAIASGANCGENCLSSSVKGTLIYFPPGTYLISTPINAYYYSQLVGDANDYPIIKTTTAFIGLGAIQSDVYVPNGKGGEWYVVQSNFYRQIRNFVIDIRGTTTDSMAAIHWQVGQATSVTNVSIAAINGRNNTQMGFFTENGSGGFMSDVTIVGGAYGIYGGNQQYTVRNFQIINQFKACICLLWDWGWTWSGLFLSGAPVGISLLNPQGSDGGGAITGSTYIMDTEFFDVNVGIEATFNKTVLESSIITLDNVAFGGVLQAITYDQGGTVVELPSNDIDFAVIGNVELNGGNYGQYTVPVPKRPDVLTGPGRSSQNNYFTRSRPQYETLSIGSIINVKDHGAKGDGKTDDTSAIKTALALATTSNLIYFPAGSYIITTTVVISPNTRITGSIWSQLVASGDYFAHMDSPKVMIQVGNKGDSGTVEISDILFTSIGALPGLIMVEWNVQASSQGSVGMWDAHFRVGGAYGTNLQVAQCSASTPSIQTGCIAVNMMMHITPGANGYFENVWAWVADHDIDDPQNTQITVGGARGILIESEGPNWLYGTASEHSIMYQYNFANASNTLAGMIQTESPYYQYTSGTISPGPYKSTVGSFSGDPVFGDTSCNGTSLMCDFAWAVLMQSSSNVTIAGAGLYSWFENYGQSCVDTQNCQQRLVYDDGNNGGFYLWNLITIGSVEMISGPEVDILAKPNTQASGHPFWSALAGYLDSSTSVILSCTDDDTSARCATKSKCDLTKRYATMADLNADSGNFPNQCMNYYAIDTLGTVLRNAMINYNNVDSGYDKVFGYYQKYMKELVPQMIQEFMKGSSSDQPGGGPGNKYFDCTLSRDGPTTTQTCPFAWKDMMDADTFTMTYTLKDENGFYDALQSTYGIQKSWVTFGDRRIHHAGMSCGRFHGEDCQKLDHQWVNEPKAADNFVVPNPKDTIAKALPAISSLTNTILAQQMDLNYGIWNGSSLDLVEAFSMPVFMVDQAVQSMSVAKSMGQKEKKEEKIKLIFEILGAVFAFIPFLDEIAPEIEVVDVIMTGVVAVADAGNVALTIASIVQDPSSAPMEILGLLTGGAGRNRDDVASIAGRKRALKDTDVAKIGSNFKKENDEFEATVKPKCKSK
ncbi:hypothetical protein N0V95_001758 [Ascochyta clinopodiicola]|nr:hypothetical protein N0V95_001758 [Ascochyta clinopodiicola]